MNQIVISQKTDEIFKVNVMGEGVTAETYYMDEKILAETLPLLLRKLKSVGDAI